MQQLPSELIYHIGGHMLDLLCHKTLCLVSQTCLLLSTNLHHRVTQAKEISTFLAYARTEDWTFAFTSLTVGQFKNLKSHAAAQFPPAETVITACVDGGNMDVLKYITKGLNLSAQFPVLFAHACFAGQLAIAQWLAENVGIRSTDDWVRQLRMTVDDAQILQVIILQHTCWSGHLHVAQWLAQQYDFTSPSLRPHHNVMLKLTCGNGHLNVVRWIIEYFHFTADDMRGSNGELPIAFMLTCENGQLNVAQWIAEEFALTAEDARSEDNYALRLSCQGGYLDVAQWLTQHFGLTAEDARARNNQPLLLSCMSGHLDVAQWLTQHFGLTADDARTDNMFALRMSRDRNHVHVVEWLVHHFGMTEEVSK
jgi:hypothetical protein